MYVGDTVTPRECSAGSKKPNPMPTSAPTMTSVGK